MTAPTNPRNLDNAIELYVAGKPTEQISAATGVSGSVLSRERRRRGIPARPVGGRLSLPAADIVSAYIDGESEYAISQRTGITRTVIRRRLVEGGVIIRHPSEAGLLRASKMPAEDRAAQVQAAHDARRGRKDSLVRLEARARAHERAGRYGSAGEELLAHLLEERGYRPIPQRAISKYNVDMAATETIAVEVLGGNWHSARRSHAIRTPEILNAGWHLIMVWNQQGTGPITGGAADYIRTFDDEVGWQPALARQYRVISGSGELLAARSADDDEFPVIPPSRRAARSRP